MVADIVFFLLGLCGACPMLGHSQIAVTFDLYSHVTATMQRQAVEALDAVLGT
jgi:hypothetical protein